MCGYSSSVSLRSFYGLSHISYVKMDPGAPRMRSTGRLDHVGVDFFVYNFLHIFVGLKRAWDQKLSSGWMMSGQLNSAFTGLMSLAFMRNTCT